MESTQFEEIMPYLLTLSLSAARIFPCVLLIPALSMNVLKGVMQTAVVMGLSLFAVPMHFQQVSQLNYDFFAWCFIFIKEIAVGLLISLFMSIPFWVYESVGALIDNQRGALMGGQINPQLGPDATPIGYLFKQLAILFLIVSIGLPMLLQFVWDSYKLWPIAATYPFPGSEGFEIYNSYLQAGFIKMVLYAGPVVGLLILIDFCFAVIGLYNPQLQATMVAIPLKCLIALFLILLYLGILQDSSELYFFEFINLNKILSSVVNKG